LEAYKHENYLKAREIDEFKSRLDNSLQLAVAKVELVYLQLNTEAHSFGHVSQALTLALADAAGPGLPLSVDAVRRLADNMDFSVMDDYSRHAPNNKDLALDPAKPRTSAYVDQFVRPLKKKEERTSSCPRSKTIIRSTTITTITHNSIPPVQSFPFEIFT